MERRFKRGMKFVHGRRGAPMYGIVLRVARDGSWVDMRWYTWRATWTNRVMTTDPLLADRHRKDWTEAEVASSGGKEMLEVLPAADLPLRHPEGY